MANLKSLKIENSRRMIRIWDQGRDEDRRGSKEHSLHFIQKVYFLKYVLKWMRYKQPQGVGERGKRTFHRQTNFILQLMAHITFVD